jgi:transposase
VVRLGDVVVILDLHRQGLTVTAIAERVGVDRKTVRKYIERGLEPPVYQPRPPRPTKVAPFERYLQDRVAAYPELTASRLLREIREQGYAGGYTRVKDVLREIRPSEPAGYEVRFETPPGRQAQVDFSFFRVVFTDEPSVERIVWLFSLVLVTAGCCGRGLSCARTCRRCCAATPRRLRRSAARRRRSCTTACGPCSGARIPRPATSSTTAP